MGFKITHLSFFKDLIQSDIICLLNYVEENEEDIVNEWVNDSKFLYDFFMRKFGNKFEPLTVLKFIYLYMPCKRNNIPKLKLSLSIFDMNELVEKNIASYEVFAAGNHYLFKELENFNGLTFLNTREKIWIEAMSMNNFMNIYTCGTPIWERQRGIFHYQFNESHFTIALRRIGSRLIVIEAKGKNGVEGSSRLINSIQAKIDILTRKINKPIKNSCKII